MAIKKADFKKVKEKFSTSAKYKPQSYFDLGPDFLDAVGVPGPAMGHINMFLGHSDTGKTTALVKTAVDAQRKGILPKVRLSMIFYSCGILWVLCRVK